MSKGFQAVIATIVGAAFALSLAGLCLCPTESSKAADHGCCPQGDGWTDADGGCCGCEDPAPQGLKTDADPAPASPWSVAADWGHRPAARAWTQHLNASPPLVTRPSTVLLI